MLIFREFFNTVHNLIKIYFKTHQSAPDFQNFLRGASIMPLNSPAYACNYNWFVFLHENSHFLFKIISKYIPKRINHKFFKNFLHENNYYPIAIVYLKYLFFYIKNCNF